MRGKQLQFFAADDESGVKRKTIVLPIDTFILLCIVTILLFIVAFSLGVEKGRKISYTAAEKKERLPNVIAPEAGPTLQVLQSDVPAPATKPAVSPVAPLKREESAVRQNLTKLPVITNRYAVQVATYYQESFAQEEARKIKARGIPAFLSKKNNLIVLFAGYFNSKEEAEKSMGSLKKTYKDCILRRF